MPPSLLSSALDKTHLRSVKSFSLEHEFPFFPFHVKLSSDVVQRGTGSKSTEELQVFCDLLNQYICLLGIAVDFSSFLHVKTMLLHYVTATQMGKL